VTPFAQLLREAFALVLSLALPVLAAVLLAGLLSAVGQSATQLRDRSLSTVPRLLVALITIGLAAPFYGARLVAFFQRALELVPRLGR
jgi:flagellar biosynthetic protein FliQ